MLQDKQKQNNMIPCLIYLYSIQFFPLGLLLVRMKLTIKIFQSLLLIDITGN